MLCSGVHQIEIGVHIHIIVDDGRIDIREEDQHCQNDQHNSIDLFLKEHTEHRFPVGVAGRSNTLRLELVMIHRCEQLGFRHIKFIQVDFIFSHSLTSLSW